MITFRDYILKEGKFKDSPKIIKVGDYPMFSVFIAKGDKISERLMGYSKRKGIFEQAFTIARDQITHMGFPSMHVNVVFRDTPDAYGLAHGNPAILKNRRSKSISLSDKFIDYISNPTHELDRYYPSNLVNTIIHEWAHIWMFNNGRAFRQAVKDYHEALVYSNIDKIPYNYGNTERIFDQFYDRISLLLQHYYKKQNPKVSNIQNSLEHIFTDTLNEYGMYGLAVDKNILTPYIIKITDLIYNNIKDLVPVANYIKNLNLEKLFDDQIKQETQRSIVKREDIRKKLSDMVKFTGSYGLKDPDETWATALEKFNTLHPHHREKIFNLMQVNEPRAIPNKRMWKHKKAKQREFPKNVTLDNLK